jgi:large subunit ribosomal protein L10
MSPKKLNPAKVASVTELKQLVADSKSIAVVDYSGLKVTQATQLRRDVRKAGGRVVVTKNTLFSIAANLKDTPLTGLSAFIFSLTDEVSAIKAVADFAKKNSVLTFKLGFLSGKTLSADEIKSLATLPSKEVLLGKTVSTLKSPLFGLAYNLNWNISQLVRTLDAVKAKKEVTS